MLLIGHSKFSLELAQGSRFVSQCEWVESEHVSQGPFSNVSGWSLSMRLTNVAYPELITYRLISVLFIWYCGS